MARVFISSTQMDLKDHRLVLAKSLRQAGFEPVGMEDFGSQPLDATQASFRELESAELFVGVYANRYGYCPDGVKSITEMEFDHAGSHNKPRFIFVLDSEYPVNPNSPLAQHAEPEALHRITEFRRRLSRLVTSKFTTPDNLAGVVLASLQREMNRRDTTSDSPGVQNQFNIGTAGTVIGTITGGQNKFETHVSGTKPGQDVDPKKT